MRRRNSLERGRSLVSDRSQGFVEPGGQDRHRNLQWNAVSAVENFQLLGFGEQFVKGLRGRFERPNLVVAAADDHLWSPNVRSEVYRVGLRYTVEPSWSDAIALENGRAVAGPNGGNNDENDLAFVPECDPTYVNVIPCCKVIEAATQIGDPD